MLTQTAKAIGDFFQTAPPGADAYLLKAVLHDWQDGEVLTILRTCRRAMKTDASLLLIERLLAPPNEGAQGKFYDLNMFVNAGGRERLQAEFAQFLDAAGFAVTDVVRTQGHLAVLSARAKP